jgi:hypothetical protein
MTAKARCRERFGSAESRHGSMQPAESQFRMDAL